MSTPGKRLKKIRASLNLSQAQLGDKVGFTWHKIKDLEAGKIRLTLDIAQHLYDKTGASINYLLENKGEMFERESSVQRLQEMENNFVLIPQVKGEIGAGGRLIPDDIVEMKVAFKKDWIQKKGDSQHMSLIRVQGDSMEPTLVSGDLVLIDHSRNYVDSRGGIYAIAIEGEIAVKRIQVLLPSRRLKIISDNNRYDPMELESDQVIINGKVIWFSRELER